MRVVDWNIEHMNSWFVANSDPNAPALRESKPAGGFGGGAIDDVPALAQRAANVIGALDPDVICIQEGAGEDEVGIFLQRFLPLPNNAAWTVLGGSGGAQKLIVAVRTDRDVTAAVLADDSNLSTQLDGPYDADTDGDAVVETDTTFARVPLVVDITAHGQPVRIINAHLKSKFVRNGERLFNGTEAEQREFFRAALVNRRRISAEAFRIRTYLDELFGADPGQLVLLVGDLNDGPGFDFFERRFVTHSVVDLVFGSVLIPEGRLTHALIVEGAERPATAFFDDFVENIQDKPLLLDHVGVSPALHAWLRNARVANTEFDSQAVPNAPNERERMPSDHRPIFVELTPAPGL